MRILPCPVPGLDEKKEDGSPVYWVAIPDEWLGKHAIKHDRALTAASEAGQTGTMLQLSIVAAILEDWHMPGMNGNTDNWKFEDMRLSVIGWLTNAVLSDYNKCFEVKKNS